MGTCCASRTDMSGKEKTGTTKGGKKTASGASAAGSGVKFNPMDEVRNTVNQVLNDTANHEILVLNVPMSGFEAFIKDL